MAKKKARRRKRKVELVWITYDVKIAFKAAMRLYDSWDAGEGPAVVRDVEQVRGESGSGWAITYRLLSAWGKEAYT